MTLLCDLDVRDLMSVVDWGGSLEREGKKCGHSKEREGNKIVPLEFLFENQNRKADEDDQRDHFLNDLQLESREVTEAIPIRRDRQAILQQCNRP